MLNGLDLFSGVGGITSSLAPWVRPLAYCETDPYCQAVLLSRMRDGSIPFAPIWDDVRTLSGGMVPRIDIIYGGFPCQDISLAGTGKGLAGKRSGLFSEVGRLVRELKPTFVFLENVPAIRTRGAETVSKEFSGNGYDCRWDVVSATEIGAPHKRERWFFLAHRDSEGLQITRSDEIKTREMGGTLSDSDPRFIDTPKEKVQSGRLSSQLCLQEGFWSEDAANLGRIHDGISPVVHRIRAMGNAVVPQQAREAFKRLMGLGGWDVGSGRSAELRG